MRTEVVQILRNLNCEFYDTFAHAFADSRAATEPGLERILGQVQSGNRVLDLGCGHGRIARLLPAGCAYTGVDFSTEILALAREQTRASTGTARFVVGDLLTGDWVTQIAPPFDWIILRAVLHHIPGLENRVAILRRAAALLAPTGHVVLANWQFTEIPRLRRRLLPWSTLNLQPEDVEPGDYLLDWQREGYGLRYVHLVDEAETTALAQAAGLRPAALFRADGHQNNLTIYAVLTFTD